MEPQVTTFHAHVMKGLTMEGFNNPSVNYESNVNLTLTNRSFEGETFCNYISSLITYSFHPLFHSHS